MNPKNSKTTMYTAIFGTSYIYDDMQFKWVNKDNILSVYHNFINRVQKNKDSYSREDCDEIKLNYQALDTRKNTLEKEDLITSDNLKIAELTIKLPTLYIVTRVGIKSEENVDTKKQFG